MSSKLIFILLDKMQAKKFNLNSSRFTYLNSVDISENGTKFQLIFNSATYSYRAKLIDSNTLNERDNPKTMDEGEKNSTHIIIKFSSNRLIVFIEQYKEALSINQLRSYLNFYSKGFDKQSPVLFSYEQIFKDNFIEELKSLKRVTLGEIFIDKEMLGSSFMNLTDNTRTVQQEIVLNIKPKLKDTIVETIKDIFMNWDKGKNKVKEIRVTGTDESGHMVKFNTGFLAKNKYIDSKIDITTGEVITDEIFRLMNNVTSEYE